MTSYRTVIVFDLPEPYTQEDGTIIYINRTKYLPIDYMDDRSITASAQVVTQPMQSGDVMSDHMYRNPVTLSINGKFSLNGRNWNNSTYSELHNEGDRLTAIEYVFERIKNEGILCTITTIASEMDSEDKVTYDKDGKPIANFNPSQTRFLTRENMALTSISWKESQNTLGFTFSFQEVIMVDTEMMYEVDISDLDLPSIEPPSTQSLGDVLFNSGELPLTITKTLQEKGYIQDEWLSNVCEFWTGAGIVAQVLIAVGVAAGIIVGSIALAASTIGATVISATAAVVPVGTVVAAAVAIVAAIGFGIWAIINNHDKNERAKKAFKLINGDYKQDLNRYMNFMDDVQSAVNSSSANIEVFQFSNDDEQQVCIPIGGNYYYITITKLNEPPYFKSDVRVNGYGNQGGDPISNMRENWCYVTNFMDLNENVNMWFKDESKKYQVYLVNPNLSENMNKTEAERENVRKKLSSYYIYISKGSIKANIEQISNAISNSLLAHDFD